MTKMLMTKAKRRLAVLWFASAGLLFLIMLVQTISDRYSGHAQEAWGWMFPTVLPNLSLIIGVLVMDNLGHGLAQKYTDAFLFQLAFGISAIYLLAVNLLILLQYFSPLSPLVLMSQSSLWLSPIQGLVTAAMGAFFVKVPRED